MPIRMTSNNTPVPFVASASSVTDSGHEPFRAFDDDSNFAWMGLAPPSWLQFDYGTPAAKHLFRYTIIAEDFFSNLFPGRVPRDWTIQASNDTLVWDVIDTRTNQTGWRSFFNLTG